MAGTKLERWDGEVKLKGGEVYIQYSGTGFKEACILESECFPGSSPRIKSSGTEWFGGW